MIVTPSRTQSDHTPFNQIYNTNFELNPAPTTATGAHVIPPSPHNPDDAEIIHYINPVGPPLNPGHQLHDLNNDQAETPSPVQHIIPINPHLLIQPQNFGYNTPPPS